MRKKPATAETGPPCYALTLPGLEAVLAEEVEQSLAATVKRVDRGLVVFRPALLDRSILRLRTAEDVYLLVWGTDRLTHRARDLEQIRLWTAREADWPSLLRWHHAIHPKPKGKPTYRLVAQKHGEHAYRRVDALEALARGLGGKFPARWQPAEENAAVEVWLTIDGGKGICGLRLSDRSMRHRNYKQEHVPASLRPVAAAAMVRLLPCPRGATLLDPTCGAGTILAEHLAIRPDGRALGGDLSLAALRAARANLPRDRARLVQWDARRLPLRDASVDCLAANPPFGKQLARPEEIPFLYRDLVREADRVLRPAGHAAFLVADPPPLQRAAADCGWKLRKKLRLILLGQPAQLSLWVK